MSEPQSNNNMSQLMVKFITKSQRHAVADTAYSIPVNSNPDTLNTLLKQILKEDANDEDVKFDDLLEFDFFINDSLLTTTISDYVQANADKIKIESLVIIEYTERYPPPEPLDSILMDDWVGSIQGNSSSSHILVGSYDNTVRLFNKDGSSLATLHGHTSAVKAVHWLSVDPEAENYKFLSSSQDQSILKWEWSGSNEGRVIRADKYVGHTESVECLAVNDDKTKLISGSWDKNIKLWNLSSEEGDENLESGEQDEPKKKKKSEVKVSVKTPIITLSGHTQNVSACKWMSSSANTACTASWDHSIKLWDIYIGQETRTIKSPNSRIFMDLDYSPLNELIVTGLNDSHCRIYDPRSKEGNVVKVTMSSHSGWCSSVSWSKKNANMFISGSYDNKTKMWDIRNNKSSLYDIVGHTEKVLCTDWSIDNLILTGSADNTFKMYEIND